MATAPDPRDDGCLCWSCGSRYKVDIIIPDDLWARISGRDDGGGLLCGHCIINRLESIGFAAFKLERIGTTPEIVGAPLAAPESEEPV